MIKGTRESGLQVPDRFEDTGNKERGKATKKLGRKKGTRRTHTPTHTSKSRFGWGRYVFLGIFIVVYVLFPPEAPMHAAWLRPRCCHSRIFCKDFCLSVRVAGFSCANGRPSEEAVVLVPSCPCAVQNFVMGLVSNGGALPDEFPYNILHCPIVCFPRQCPFKIFGFSMSFHWPCDALSNFVCPCISSVFAAITSDFSFPWFRSRF